MKKFLLFFAALCCTLLAGAFEVDGVNYNITSATAPYTVEVGNNKSFTGTTVTIPASVIYDDITYSVTSIGMSAFDGCEGLTSITLPASVTSIGTSAFWNNGLTSVTFAEGSQLTSIGMNAFSYCKFSSINIPASVTDINQYAFSDCSNLTSFDIPSSVTSIGEKAFYGCSGLTDITVNWASNIPTIDANVFENVNLSNATLHTPPGTALLYEAATVWSSFGSIKAPTNEIWYTSSDGNVVKPYAKDVFGANITNNTYSNGKGIITFDGEVTSIGAQAFQGCTSLTSINLPNSVTSIGEYAFDGCSGLTSVTFAEGCLLESIGNMALQNCSNLNSINIPASVTSIGENAFEGCSGLTDVTVNWTSNISTIAANVFGNVNLSNATLHTPPGTASLYEAATVWSGFGSTKEACNEIWYTSSDGNVVTPNNTHVFGATIITNTYKNGKGVITFSGDVTSIGYDAFSDRSSLTNITLPNSVTSIGEYAFSGCSNLTSLILPNSVTSIDMWAFYGCSGLTSFHLPNSVTNIGIAAFSNCSGLTSITVESDNPNYDSHDNCNAIIETNTNTLVVGCKNTIIPNSVTSIEENAFFGCTGLTSITLPSSVTSIRDDAFSGCSNLTSINIPNSVTSIGERVFQNCSKMTSIILPNSVTSIGMGAFYGCTKLTDVIVNWTSEIPTINANVFEGIELSNATLHVPMTTASLYEAASGWNSFGNIIEFILSNEIWYTSSEKISDPDASKFGEEMSITSHTYENGKGVITFSGDVTGIGENAFYNCSKLTSIILPNSVTSIGNSAFACCYYLTSISIPNSVTSIRQMAFRSCYLTSIILPNSVTNIGMGAFYGCTKLTSATFHSLPSAEGDFLGGCSNLSNVTLDLTDSEKPYIGTTLDNYPNFTKASYTRSSAKDKWGTIVLPFVPESTTGLEFYALSSMTTADGGSLTFTKVDEIEAGKPYLFRNTSGSDKFTLTKTSPTITVATSDQTVGDFAMKGSFQQTQLDGATNTHLYYLSNDQFWHANGKINIAPFRAYIEGSGASKVKSFVLMIEDNGTVNAIPGILTEDGDIDETEGIYDLSGRKLDAPRKGQVNIIRTKGGKTVKRMF